MTLSMSEIGDLRIATASGVLWSFDRIIKVEKRLLEIEGIELYNYVPYHALLVGVSTCSPNRAPKSEAVKCSMCLDL